jgi:hypothetical protein
MPLHTGILPSPINLKIISLRRRKNLAASTSVAKPEGAWCACSDSRAEGAMSLIGVVSGGHKMSYMNYLYVVHE